MENLEQTLLKGYRLEERIGSGGFGAVYRAKQTTVDREVAVKIILPSYANNPDFIRRFESEANTIARLEHPHITPLIDYWRDPEGAYLVMRFLKGGSIREALRDGPYEMEAISHALDQLASALDFAHRNNVIHRDIKPGNLLLDEDGNIYLADFGIAKDLSGLRNSNNTAVDSVVGSLDYISPEQARAEPVTPRTDIYSLGVTLYEMITGEHPFKDASTVERLYKHISDPLPDIENLDDSVRDQINEIIQKATAKDPDKRYPDVLALAVAFREAIGRTTMQAATIVEQLTMREQEILSMIVKGMSNREIADTLVVTLGTVKWHIRQIYGKLGVRSRVHAIIRARELNLIVSNDSVSEIAIYDGKQSLSISLPEPENPYKGLRAFQTTDAHDFFGRDDLTQKLVEHMKDKNPHYRFMAIVGPSGSGKSSLVRAGIVPALWRGALPGSEKWFVVDMIPGTHPLDKLETALIRVAANQANNLREQLQRDERGLLRVSDIILPGDDTELVIFVDQFEEVFTLVENEKERQHFLDLIATAVSDVHSRVRVILTLRADYYDRPLLYPEFGELIRSRMETVLPLTAQGLERAIRGPAERVGVTFERGLVEQFVSEVNYQSGALPLLQYALTELFDRRSGRQITHEAYQHIGGAVGALTNRADEVYDGLIPEGQELAQQMFMRLVTLGEGAEDTRRRATQAELLSLTENTDLMEEIIDQFSAYRLLSLDHDAETRQPIVEVAHEAILKEWDRLRDWINDSRTELRLQRQLAGLVSDWEKANKDKSYLLRGARLSQFEAWARGTSLTLTPNEKFFLDASLNDRNEMQIAEQVRQQREVVLEKRSQQRLRYLVGVLALLALAAVVFSIFALDREQKTQDALTEAESARATSDFNAAQAQELALINGARAALADGNYSEALAFALAATNRENPSSAAQVILAESAYNNNVARVMQSASPIVKISAHPDGQHLLSVPGDGVEKALWDVTTGEIVQRFDPDNPEPVGLSSGAISPDGKLAAFGQDDGQIVLYDLATGDEFMRLVSDADYLTLSLAFSPDSSQLITGHSLPDFQIMSCSVGALSIWNLETAEIEYQLEGHSLCIPSVGYSADGGMVWATGSVNSSIFDDSGTVTFWDAHNGEFIKTIGADGDGHAAVVAAAALTKDNSILVTAGWDAALIFWDFQTDTILQRLDGFFGNFSSATLALSPDDRLLSVTTGDEDQIALFDMASMQKIRTVPDHPWWVTGMAFLNDNYTLVSKNADNTIYLYDLRYGAEQDRIQVSLGSEIGPDDDYIVDVAPQINRVLYTTIKQPIFSEGDHPIAHEIHDLANGELVAQFTWNDVVNAIDTALIDEDHALTLLHDGTLIVWDLASGEEIRRLETVANIGLTIGQIINDTAVLVPDQDRTEMGSPVVVIDLETGDIQLFSREDHKPVTAMLSPDGTILLTGGKEDEKLLQWDRSTGELVRELDFHNGWVLVGDIDEQNRTALSIGTGDNVLTQWNLESGEVVQRYQSGTTSRMNFAWFTDSGIIFSGTEGIRLFDEQSGELLRNWVAGNPNDFYLQDVVENRLFVRDTVNSIRRVQQVFEWWRLDTLEELKTFASDRRYSRELTCEERVLYQIEPLCDD